MRETSWEVIIAGGGPAGLSAALMLGRARRAVLGQEGLLPGDLLERCRR